MAKLSALTGLGGWGGGLQILGSYRSLKIFCHLDKNLLLSFKFLSSCWVFISVPGKNVIFIGAPCKNIEFSQGAPFSFEGLAVKNVEFS